MNEITNQKVAWVGSNKPFPHYINFSSPFEDDNLYRSDPKHHRSFDRVYSHEFDLGKFKQWPLVLDEILRLLNPEGGVLSLRYSETNFLTCFNLKNILFSRFGRNCEIEKEIKWDDGTSILTLRVHSQVFNRSKSWSFGIIYDGSKINNLIKFIESVESQQFEEQYEILVCGPNASELEGKNVKVLEFGDKFNDKGWITEKKNFIIDKAKFENICIVHNRYILGENFIKGFSNFGYDFDVVVSRQVNMDGTRFPDWVTVGSDWNWSRPGILEYFDYSPYMYMNGGMIIGKKSILQTTPLNPLLFWNQAEDVEFTRRLAQKGYTLRLNISSTARVIESRQGYVESFQIIPYEKYRYNLPMCFSLAGYRYRSENTVLKISRMSIIDKLLEKFLKLRGLSPEVIRNRVRPLYLKLKPFIIKSQFLSGVISKVRTRVGI